MPEVVLHCADCGLPWAKVTNGCLIVESRHHGQRHVNAIPLDALLGMAGGTAQATSNTAAELRPGSPFP